MAVTKETVYIKAEQSVEVRKRDVILGDIAKFECANPDIIPKVKALKILRIPEEGRHRHVISILKIIECIHEKYPSLEIQNMGEKDIIVKYENQKTPGSFLHGMKVAVVSAITFVGAAFSIMAFNNDVDTSKMFGQIYELLMGTPSDGFTVLELTYCIGLIIGILVFFNHFGGKKFSVDPTPMEVEMRMYENDIQTTLIENYSRKEKEMDVGKTTASGGIGLSAGMSAALGLFAFIVGLGVVSDFADRTHTGKYVLLYETCISLGGIIGNIVFVYHVKIGIGQILVPVFGMFSGIFVGCWSMALAEVLNVFPIFVRRVKLLKAIPFIILSIAIGKGVGALLFFAKGW